MSILNPENKLSLYKCKNCGKEVPAQSFYIRREIAKCSKQDCPWKKK